MSARWFRFYDEVVDDPKVQTLSPELFKAWVNLLCIASKNDGIFPAISKIAFHLRCDETVVERTLERLSNEGLIDRRNGGVNGYHYAPHGWDKRQYKSDSSNERVKRYRQRQRETAPETDTESEDNTDVLSGNGVEKPEKPNRKKSEPFNEDRFELPSDIPSEAWASYVASRRALKKPIKTMDGANGIITQLRKFAEDGHPPGAVLMQSVAFEYQGVFPLKTGRVTNGNGSYHNEPDTGPVDPMAQAIIARQARRAGEQSGLFGEFAGGGAEVG